MKKILLIPWMIALMLFCNTYLDALSLDGTLQSEALIFNQNRIIDIHNYQVNQNNLGEYYQLFDFDYTNSNNYEYMVIPYALTKAQNYTTYGDVDGYTYDSFIDMVFRITLTTSGGPWAPCEIQNNMIVCKLNNSANYTGIIIDYVDPVSPNYSTQYNYIYFHNYAQLWNTNTRETTNAINNQTQQQQQQYQEATNGTWQPNNNINTDQTGANETIEYSQKEEQLMSEIEINETSLDNVFGGINLNPTASAYIWDIATGIRNMNPKLILLFTTILALGIIKMVLNR